MHINLIISPKVIFKMKQIFIGSLFILFRVWKLGLIIKIPENQSKLERKLVYHGFKTCILNFVKILNPKNDVLKDWYHHVANIWIYNNQYEINKKVFAKPSLSTRMHNLFQLCGFDMNPNLVRGVKL